MKRLTALLTGFVMALGLAGCMAGVPAAGASQAGSDTGPAVSSNAPAPAYDTPPAITPGTQTLRGFLNDNVLHSPDAGDIHYSSYIPARYDGSTPAARLSPTTPP